MDRDVAPGRLNALHLFIGTRWSSSWPWLQASLIGSLLPWLEEDDRRSIQPSFVRVRPLALITTFLSKTGRMRLGIAECLYYITITWCLVL